MLKRTLGIGILTALAVFLTAASPPRQNTDYEGQITYSDGNETIMLFWGTYTGELPTSPTTFAQAPAAYRLDLTIPEEALALLPPGRRARFERFNTDGYTYDVADDEWDCARIMSHPYPSGSDEVKAYGGISCLGSVIAYTRFGIELTSGSTTVASYDSGWKTWLAHRKTVTGDCLSGFHLYKNEVGIAVQFMNGTTAANTDSASSYIECE